MIREIKQHDEYSRPVDAREYTGDFVGWNRPLHKAQGTAESPRQRLLKWAAKYPDMHIRQDVPYSEALKGSINSKFCFIPRGKSGWSSRLFRVLYAKCVPVLLNDDYEIPFLGLFENKDEWLIRWPMREVNDDLALLLRNFDNNVIENMIKKAEEAKCWYTWTPATVDSQHIELQQGDLDQVCPNWREQNAYLATNKLLFYKKRVTKASTRTFYMPDPITGKTLYVNEDFELI